LKLRELSLKETAMPLVAIPFATSIVLVMGSPEVEAAQPRALVGGHIVSTIVGLVVLNIAGPEPWAAALAVGLAIAAMQFTRTFHPPPGIDPLLVVVNNMPWGFLLVPVASARFCLHFLRLSGTSSFAGIRGRYDGGECIQGDMKPSSPSRQRSIMSKLS
jgi:CBS-domain-containing membrane protein